MYLLFPLQFSITIVFAEDSVLPWGSDQLTLCFDDAPTAEAWRTALEETICTCRLHITTDTNRRHRAYASESADAAAVLSSLPSTEDHPSSSSAMGNGTAENSSPSSSSLPLPFSSHPSTTTTTIDATTTPPTHPLSTSTTSTTSRHRNWQSVHHVNGVAVYAEEENEEGEGGAFMASVVVRAPPRACFQALMRTTPSGGTNTTEIPFSDSVVLLESIDAHTQVVRHAWTPERGVGRWFVAPRDLVALRSWRKEPDGTYIVLYQSTNHKKARQEQRGWFAPVRAKVQAAGFTISPLLPQYVPSGGPSQECLVTLVVKADLAGSLSPTSLLSRWASVVADSLRWAVLSPLLMSVVALRDRVEQRRFVVMPYTMAADGDEFSSTNFEEESSMDGSSQPPSPGPGSYIQRTTTSLTVEPTATAAASPSTPSTPSTSRPTPSTGSSAPPPPPLWAASSSSLASGRAASIPLPPVVEMEDGVEEDVSDAIDYDATTTTNSTTTTSLLGQQQVPIDQSAVQEDAWAVCGTTPRKYWSNPGTCNLRIRGANYLVDRVKIPALAPMFDLYTSDLVDNDEPNWNIASSLPSMRACSAPFAFVLNLIYPANGMLQSLVTTWTAPVDVAALDVEALVEKWGDDPAGTVRSFFQNLKPWMEGDGEEADARRNIKFKLIPKVPTGSWVVRQSVGTTPVLLGQKLKTKYFRGRSAGGCSYFECDVDITSNTVANSVTRLVVNSITSLVVDLAPLVEGRAEEELPERLIGTVRYDHLDLRTSSLFDEYKGTVVQRPPSSSLSST